MYIIDRIEGDLAVVETDSGFINVPLGNISGRIRDGAVLACADGGFTVDEDATAARLDAARRRRRRLSR